MADAHDTSPSTNQSVVDEKDAAGEVAAVVTAAVEAVSYTHLRAHETDSYLVCRLLLHNILLGFL